MKKTASLTKLVYHDASAVCELCKAQKEIRGKAFVEFSDKIRHIMEEEFIMQSKDFVRYVEDNPRDFALVRVEKQDQWEKFFREAQKRLLPKIFPLYTKIHELGQLTEARDVSEADMEAVSVSSDRANYYAEKASMELVSRINDTTREELRELFATEWRAGSSIPEITEKIQAKFSNFNSYRS